MENTLRREDDTIFTNEEVVRMKDLLEQIDIAKQELATIQHYHESYSIQRICEPASQIVKEAGYDVDYDW